MSALLEIREASKAFGGVQAVTRVSLEAQKGEILSVIGPNGAGKTTVLNMISGFYHPDTGRIVLEGRDVTDLAPSRIAELGIARTFQNIALFRGMTVLDNLLLGRHVHMKTGVLSAFAYWGFAQKEEVLHRKRVEDIIDFLRIQDLRRRPTGSLAYGLQKRVELGRALMARPTLMLLDEPSMGLAPKLVAEIYEIVARLNREEGVAVLLAEQNATMALQVAQHGYVMENGRIVLDGDARTISQNEDIKEFYLGLTGVGQRKSYRDVKHYRRRKRWLS